MCAEVRTACRVPVLSFYLVRTEPRLLGLAQAHFPAELSHQPQLLAFKQYLLNLSSAAAVYDKEKDTANQPLAFLPFFLPILDNFSGVIVSIPMNRTFASC